MKCVIVTAETVQNGLLLCGLILDDVVRRAVRGNGLGFGRASDDLRKLGARYFRPEIER